jgi:hypothetical protein
MRFGAVSRSAYTSSPHSRLAEIWEDLNARLDAEEVPDEATIAFVKELQRRMEWVDLLADIRAHLEAAPWPPTSPCQPAR